MNRCDVTTPVSFQKGYYHFCAQANFNFQLNRVIMWDGGRKEDVDKIGASISTSESYTEFLSNLRLCLTALD